jgi:hypothetical protein
LSFLTRSFLEHTMKNPQDMERQMGAMQESMLTMHEQMHKIMNAKNPQQCE